MSTFASNIIYNFLIAFGVIVGASLFAGLGALINDHPPLKSMFQIASSIKIWAVAVALGGTFSTFEILEKGIFKGEIRSIIKQAVYVVVAVLGANVGYGFIRLIQRCGETMFK
ncbi:YtrH family sporulation protein [Acetivibrio mesophilus]|mgnify:FL=1|uniref:Sporulation protein n=1 Tax=Acetivibrio mesophilus TaxID=2487273 RepID=A0A4Q0I5F1_9FIRM|nr:YtrH family sporulation protein [Acetivibrio mesophilus]ODM26099.1 sporulation protein [Clostridium sp. Bc-iso-3]RXE59067.1 sporulation protein [Acetivibrio mesophilus]HHV28305.1 sporulation protein [Clostridium sp.]